LEHYARTGTATWVDF